MLIPPDEHALLLAERWLKLLSNLGRAQATLAAYRSALRHFFAFCSQRRIEPEKARFEDLTPISVLFARHAEFWLSS